MCAICLEYEKGKMTAKEALNNIGEMLDSTQDEEKQKHLFELANKVMDKEQPFDDWDAEDSMFGLLDELDYAFMPEED